MIVSSVDSDSTLLCEIITDTHSIFFANFQQELTQWIWSVGQLL